MRDGELAEAVKLWPPPRPRKTKIKAAGIAKAY